MSTLLVLPVARASDSNINPYSGALLDAFLTGTTTRTPVYTTSALTVEHTNPVVADSAGLWPAIYLDPSVSYRFRARTSAGVNISGMDFDPVVAPSPGAIPVLSNYGPLATTSDAAATVTAALAAVDSGGALTIDEEADIGTAAVSNPGVNFVGEKPIFYAPASGGGDRVMNLPGRTEAHDMFGQECLVRWLEGLRAGSALTAHLVGDSNTSSNLGAALATLLGGLYNVTVTNNGISGTHIEQWRTGTGDFSGGGATKNQAAVIAAAPKLIVMCWGTNDPTAGRDADDFETSLRASLTTIRATLGVQSTSILLMTPNAMNAADGRDEAYSLRLRPIIRQAAIDFQCAFLDKNALFSDAFADFGSGSSQNKFLDSARVHTTALSQALLLHKVYDFLVPQGIRADASGMIADKAVTDLPATYPKGWSLARADTGSSAWPFNGFALTFNPSSTGGQFPLQVVWSISQACASFRTTTATNTWGNFNTLGTAELGQDAYANSTAVTSYPIGHSIMRITTSFPLNGFVHTYREQITGNNGYQIQWAASGDTPHQIRTYGGGAWTTWRTLGHIEFTGSATYDPGSLADGAGATTTVTCTGAALGDFALASFSLDLQGITVTAWVSAADTVSVRFQNESGGVLDLASGTLRVRASRA